MGFLKNILGMGDVREIVETGADVAKTFSNKEQGTRRQEIDMLSDTPLSKNIRPIIAVWSLVLLSAYLVCLGFGVEFNDQIGETVFWLVVLVMGFYFPGRTAEKWMKTRK